MAERLPGLFLQEDARPFIGFNRSHTVVLPYRHSIATTKSSDLEDTLTNKYLSCPESLNYLTSQASYEFISPSKRHPTMSETRNNSETDSTLREEIVGLSAQTEVVHTLTESLEDIFAEPRPAKTDNQSILSPTSQEMCSFPLPPPNHKRHNVEDSDLNSDFSTSVDTSPLNASDSSMSASNSDFSSTEQKDSKPHVKKAKESVSIISSYFLSRNLHLTK